MRRRSLMVILLVVSLLSLVMAGCSSRPKSETAPAKPSTPQGATVTTDTGASTPAVKTPSPTVDRTNWPVIVAVGDSLTAGLRVPAEQNYPSQLQALLDEQGYKYRVVNAGISGDTTAGGLNRVGAVLEHKPQIVILALGANDGLQGKSIPEMKKNLAAMIARFQKAGVTVLLAGMMAPPNYGPDYTQDFHQVYIDLAESYKTPFMPFLLDQVAGMPELNQVDGIHPTPEGYAIVVQHVLAALEPLLKK